MLVLSSRDPSPASHYRADLRVHDFWPRRCVVARGRLVSLWKEKPAGPLKGLSGVFDWWPVRALIASVVSLGPLVWEAYDCYVLYSDIHFCDGNTFSQACRLWNQTKTFTLACLNCSNVLSVIFGKIYALNQAAFYKYYSFFLRSLREHRKTVQFIWGINGKRAYTLLIMVTFF